jgi:hypothetical protein
MHEDVDAHAHAHAHAHEWSRLRPSPRSDLVSPIVRSRAVPALSDGSV